MQKPGRLILVALLGLAAGLWTWTRPGDPALYPAASGQPVVEGWILDNGFHTDLALPRSAFAETPGPLSEAVRSLGPGEWILIGWGDAKFYVDQSPITDRLPDGARAFFSPGNPSVVMLDPEQADPRTWIAEDGRQPLRLSPVAFTALARRVEASLELSTGSARVAAARPGDDARFFASHETFSILHLCNHWTAAVLSAAGVPIQPLRAITSTGVMVDAARANRPQALDAAQSTWQ